MSENIPVHFNGAIVGYSADGGKTFVITDTFAKEKIESLLHQGETISVSVRSLGEIADDKTIKETRKISCDILNIEHNPSETASDKLELDISPEYSVWVANLLERGLMEHQTSYRDLIPVPDEVISFIKKFYKQTTEDEL